MCHCINIDFGTYANATAIKTPTGKIADIDNCILDEVRNLWAKGVITHESCCGHNKAAGYIAVASESIPRMLELGYIAQPDQTDIFYPMNHGSPEK